MDRVLTVGEALVDIVHGAGGIVSEHPGGSVANVAVALARLGQPVHLATWIGTDPHGAAIATWLAEAGVQLTAGSTRADRTPTATAHLADDGRAAYTFDLDWAPQAAPSRGAEAASVEWADARGAAALHTGSLATLLEPGTSAVADLVEVAREHATISYDPNIRPALIDDVAGARRSVEAWIGRADVVKASADDVAWIYPGDDLRDVARRWQQAGPAVVVITRGDAGAWAACRRGEVDHPGRQVAVVDTVGAGDTFTGALLWGLAGRGLLGAAARPRLDSLSAAELEHLVAVAACAAELSVGRPGADPPTLPELRAACGSVIV